jgi:hypothetical protein
MGSVVGLRAHWSSIHTEEILRGRRSLGVVSSGLSLFLNDVGSSQTVIHNGN